MAKDTRNRSTKPADVEAEAEATVKDKALAAVFSANRITFRIPTAEDGKVDGKAYQPVPGVAELAAAIETALREKYGYDVRVELTRTDD